MISRQTMGKLLGITAICLLAVVFGIAGGLKIYDPAAFAHDIHGFGLTPLWAVAPLAILLPWWEIGAALALAFKRTRLAGAVLITFMLVGFLIAIVTVMIRGETVTCGCFGVWSPTVGWPHLVLDGFLLLASIYLCCRTLHTPSGKHA